MKNSVFKMVKRVGSVLMAFSLMLSSINLPGMRVAEAASTKVYFIKDVKFIKTHKDFTTPNGYEKSFGDNDNIKSDSPESEGKGNYLYCLEPGIHLNTGDTAKGESNPDELFVDDSNRKGTGRTTPDKKAELISLLAAREGFMKTWKGEEGYKSKVKYLVGQCLIWEVTGGARDADFKLIDKKYSLKNIYEFNAWDGKESATAKEIKEYFNERYDSYVSQIQKILETNKKISFADGKKHELPYDKDSKSFKETFKDDNSVVQLFERSYYVNGERVRGTDYITASPTKNSLSFTTKEGVSISKDNPLEVRFTGDAVYSSAKLNGWIPTDNDKQKIVSFGSNTSKDITCSMKLWSKDLPKLGGIRVQKYDPLLDRQAPIEGVEITIKAGEDIKNQMTGEVVYSNGALVDIIRTDSSGIATKTELHPGKYVVQEKLNPIKGYKFDSSPKEVTVVGLEPGQLSQLVGLKDVYIPNSSESLVGKLKLTKLGEHREKLFGAEFKIVAAEKITNPSGNIKTYYNKGDVVASGLKVDSNGVLEYYKEGNAEATPSDYALHPGKYHVIETKAPNGYYLDSTPHEVVVEPEVNTTEDIIPVSLDVENKETLLRLGKIDKDTGVYVAGAELKLVNRETDEVIDTWVSKKEPHVIKKIPVGTKLKLVEVKAPFGYIRDESIEFTVKNDLDGQDIKLGNKKAVGKITVIKNGDVAKEFVPASELVGFVGGKFVYKDSSLPNATFEIYANEVIKDLSTGKVIYNKGDKVDTLTTNASGKATSKELPLGKYYVKESKATEGYVLDDRNREVELTYEDDQTRVVYDSASVTNDRQKVSVLTVKKDRETEEVLSGAEFTIYAKEDIKNVLGDVIVAKDTAIETVVTGKDGKAKYAADLPLGVYYIKETKAPSGYVTNKKVFDVDASSAEQTKTVVKVEHEITNKETEVEISKVDITNKEELPGASLEVLDSKGNVIDSWVSNEEPHIIKGLLVGETYTLKETKPSEGYVTAESIEFVIEDTEEVQKHVMEDDYTKVQFTKTDIVTGEPVIGAQLSIIPVKEDGTLDEGAVFDTWVTEADDPETEYIDESIHYIEKLTIGKYVLREVLGQATDYGYVTAKDVEFEVKDTGEIQKVEMKDDFTKVEITKVDVEGKAVKGAVLQVVPLDEEGKPMLGESFDTWETVLDDPETKDVDESIHRIDYLPIGKYVLIEKTSPEGYVKASNVEFEVLDTPEVHKVVMTDKRVSFTKYDVTGEVEIPGAEIVVKDKDGNEVDKWVSSEEPHYISGLEEGETYTLTETLAPNGFVKATDIEFTVTKDKVDQKVDMKDKVVNVSKVNPEGGFVAGAKLQVISTKTKDIVDEWVTDDKAHLVSGLSEGGSYILKEVETPKGYVPAKDIEFTVSSDKVNQDLRMVDKQVKVTKLDVDGKLVVGATLSVLDKDGKVVDTWVTSDKEAEHIVLNLVMGETYTLREDKTPEGFVKATDIQFTVEDDGKYQTITMFDKKVTVTKTDITNSEELPGAEIVVNDKETGEEVDRWVSTEEPHEVKNLEEGKTYILTEITAPKGYELTESIEFTVEGINADGVKVNQHYTMEDAPILTDVVIRKVDSSTKKAITGKNFEFTLFADKECKEKITSVKGNSKTGLATFKDLRYGTYYIKETKAPMGYRISKDVVKVVINDKTKGVGSKHEISFENTKILAAKTGDESSILLFSVLAVLSLVGLFFVSRRKKDEIE